MVRCLIGFVDEAAVMHAQLITSAVPHSRFTRTCRGVEFLSTQNFRGSALFSLSAAEV